MNEFVLIAGMAAVTFGVRYPVLALVSRITLPTWAIRALRYVPVAVLTAITVPEIATQGGDTISFAFTNPYLWAGILSALIAWRTRKLLPTILIGMTIFFVWKALFGG